METMTGSWIIVVRESIVYVSWLTWFSIIATMFEIQLKQKSLL